MKSGPWKEEATSPSEARAAALFEAAARIDVPPPPAFEKLASVPRVKTPRVVVKTLVVMLSAGVLWGLWWSSSPDVVPAVPFVRPVAAVVVEPPRVIEVVETPPSKPQPPAPVPRRVSRASREVQVVIAEAAPKPSTLGEEAALISAALQALRQANEPTRALAVLGDYHARFPDGVLRDEALLAQAQTERALRHPAAALALLDIVGPSANENVAGELDVTRGELLAELNRCQEAEAAFTRALATSLRGALAERASWGRASCASQRSSPDAQRLLREFLGEFPDGVHAGEAADVLSTVQLRAPTP